MKTLGRREAIKGLSLSLGVLSPWLSPAISFAKTDRPRIKIGQIGVGHAHANKLSVYRESPDYEVVGIVEPDASLREKAILQPTFRDLPWMTQEELLSIPGLQAVLVETKVRDLLNTAESCVAAGKHIHLDKPAGESLLQFEQLLRSAEEKKLLVQMGYMFRYNPAVVLMREFLRQGWLGEIFEVHAVMSKVVGEQDRKFAGRVFGRDHVRTRLSRS